MARLKGLFEAYGPVALVVWLAIFGLTWAGLSACFAFGLELGFELEGMSASAGAIGTAYLATQVLKPFRILATVALTPLIARLLGRSPSPAAVASPEIAEDKEGAQGAEAGKPHAEAREGR